MIAIMANQLDKFLEDITQWTMIRMDLEHIDWSILNYNDADSCQINSDSKIP